MVKNIFKNRKGYSTGFSWVFALVSLFGLGILYIVFNQVFVGHLVPTIKDMSNSSISGGLIPAADTVLIASNIDKFMYFFHAMPYILFFTIIIYMIVAAVRKEGESREF